jgi:hypothetical protein
MGKISNQGQDCHKCAFFLKIHLKNQQINIELRRALWYNAYEYTVKGCCRGAKSLPQAPAFAEKGEKTPPKRMSVKGETPLS